MIPGEMLTKSGEIILNEDRVTENLRISNIGDRPIQVGSHFHFFETNTALVFDRKAALGFRLDIPSGSSVRFEPGQSRDVSLVAIGGARIIYGFDGLINGKLES